MRRAWFILRAIATSVVLTMPVWADAPLGGPDQQYEAFNQDSTVISDRFTKLDWLRRSAKVSFDEARLPATCLDATAGFAGRLPSLKELLTIFDEESHSEYINTAETIRYVDFPAFGKPSDGSNIERTPAGAYWTSSFVADGDSVWTVDFAKGEVAAVSTTGGPQLLRCVQAH